MRRYILICSKCDCRIGIEGSKYNGFDLDDVDCIETVCPKCEEECMLEVLEA